MLNISKIIGKFIKNSSQRDINKLKITVEKINSWEEIIKDHLRNRKETGHSRERENRHRSPK